VACARHVEKQLSRGAKTHEEAPCWILVDLLCGAGTFFLQILQILRFLLLLLLLLLQSLQLRTHYAVYN
jgi:hypothetical protein